MALHVVNDPYGELKNLENLTGQRIRYYTIHGTEKLRKIHLEEIEKTVAKNSRRFSAAIFPPIPTQCLDNLCYATHSTKP